MCSPINCTAPRVVTANPDVTGPGVIISLLIMLSVLIITTLTTFLISSLREQSSWSRRVLTRCHIPIPLHTSEKMKIYHFSLKKLLLSFSDQQLATGITIQIVAYWQICSLSIYHFYVVGTFASVSTAAHSLSVLALDGYLITNRRIVRWRLILSTINCLLLMPATYIISTSNTIQPDAEAGTISMSAPTSCIFTAPGVGSWIDAFNSIGVPLYILRATVVAISSSPPLDRIHPISMGELGASYLLIFAWRLRKIQAFGVPPVEISGSEREWGFGQILPIVILLLQFLNSIEVFREEKNKCQNESEKNDSTFAASSQEASYDETSEFHMMRHDTEAEIGDISLHRRLTYSESQSH